MQWELKSGFSIIDIMNHVVFKLPLISSTLLAGDAKGIDGFIDVSVCLLAYDDVLQPANGCAIDIENHRTKQNRNESLAVMNVQYVRRVQHFLSTGCSKNHLAQRDAYKRLTSKF